MITTKRGDFRHFISVIQRTEKSNRLGASGAITETTFLQCWAAIWPVSAKEQITGEKQTDRVTHRIRIDYAEGVSTSMVATYGARRFEILGIVNPEERNIYLDILAIEKT